MSVVVKWSLVVQVTEFSEENSCCPTFYKVNFIPNRGKVLKLQTRNGLFVLN